MRNVKVTPLMPMDPVSHVEDLRALFVFSSGVIEIDMRVAPDRFAKGSSHQSINQGTGNCSAPPIVGRWAKIPKSSVPDHQLSRTGIMNEKIEDTHDYRRRIPSRGGVDVGGSNARAAASCSTL